MVILKPPSYASSLDSFIKTQNGQALAIFLNLKDVHAVNLMSSLPVGDRTLDNFHPTYLNIYSRKLSTPWSEIAIAHTQAIVALNDTRPDPVTGRPRFGGDAITAYDKQHEVVNALYRWMMSSSAPSGWALPILYAVCRDLRRIAASADEQRIRRGEKATKLEDGSRLLQKCFSACVNDRTSDPIQSRKMGTYYMATLLFKTYLKLKSTALCKNIIKGIQAAELMSIEHYPSSHQVTYSYYLGVFAFLREDYTEAENMFLRALHLCHNKSTRNIDLILDYLIPVLLLRGVLPSKKLLRRSNRLSELYGPFTVAFRTGDLALYDQQLQKAQARLMEKGTYLIVERAREGALRALMKKAWILEGKPARMAVGKFQFVFAKGANLELDSEEVECLLANLIHKNLMKGYISHAHQIVVLSKDKPFPIYTPFSDHGPLAARVS